MANRCLLVRAFRGMKNVRYKIERKLDRYNHLMELIRTLTGLTVLILQIILLLSLGSCNVSKRTKPCTQCPHYSLTEKQKLEYIKLNPFPTVLAYEKNN